MRAVVQRVREAAVAVAGRQVAAIGPGLLVLVGVGTGDEPADATWLADKLAHLRIFENTEGKFDRSVNDVGGAILLVSQFTLYGDTRKGRRPSFSAAAHPEQAAPLCEAVAEQLRRQGVPVAVGQFGAHMQVALVNDGPVTLWLDSEARRLHADC
ncbi:MAG: D-tyrosyl-tRNA(Tyr) deacylase [Deltaproteobacteria bacterium]|nr:D-tyrosyl-tRNA(Tyr) deacylase [Deltaproteobacteria bacterium]